MKIINLTEKSTVYTANVYFILGTWNALPDVNTLIDAGRDPQIIEKINTTSTGLGKKQVEQVILTHSHYDHAGLLPMICAHFKPTVYAFSPYLEHVDKTLKDGDKFKAGDRIFEVIHTPGHSQDSICLYCEEEKVLFAGDTPLIIHRPGDSYRLDFILALEKLVQRDIQAIYFGHGRPLLAHCHERLSMSLKNIRNHKHYRK